MRIIISQINGHEMQILVLSFCLKVAAPFSNVSVYDDVTYVHDDVTYVHDDVTYVYDNVTHSQKSMP